MSRRPATLPPAAPAAPVVGPQVAGPVTTAPAAMLPVAGTAQATPAVQQIAAEAVAAHAANLANAVTGIYGVSGSGKSSLADTAAEYCAEEFGKITLCYAADLGGYGSKRLVLIRRGVLIAYDPRNRRDPFETMELISMGAFPAYLLPGGPATREDRERGYAPPDAELVLPHRRRWSYVCPNDGERVGAFYSPQQMIQEGAKPCPKCGYACQPGDPKVRVEMAVVRSKGFARVGHRIYDSMTALNEWGLSNMQQLSADGLLPKSGEKGGSLLGAADALVSGQFRFGSSSEGQYGFLQSRSYNWIANIRAIPDQVVPATMTFMVEQSKGDEKRGGSPVFGPKIAGNARTGDVPGWLGNCLYAERDPVKRVHRLWLVNHVDPLDPRQIPFVAKHRGTPLGMPDFLEDEVGKPWGNVSLGVLYRTLDAQIKTEEAATAEKWAAFAQPAEETEEVVTSAAAASAPGVMLSGGAGSIPAVPGVSTGAASPAPSLPGRAGRRPAMLPPGVSAGLPAQPAPPAQPSLPVAPIAGPAAPLAVAPAVVAPTPQLAPALDLPTTALPPVPQPQQMTPAAPAAAAQGATQPTAVVGTPPAHAPAPPAPPAVAAPAAGAPVASRRPTRTPRPPV